MRIAIFGAGSQGDIQPCARLGRRLQQAGVPVLLAAPQNFADLAHGAGLPFHALRGDVQQIMAGETGQKYMQSGGGNPIRSILAMRKMLGPVALAPTKEKVAQYVAIHATLVGVRGTLFQMLGVGLYMAFGDFRPPLVLAALAYVWACVQMFQLDRVMGRKKG